MTEGWYLFEDANGWRYLLPMDHNSLTLSIREILFSYVPAFLLLALAVLIAWYSGRAWYYPINRLITQVAPDAPSAPAENSGDEADILSRSYSSARAEKDQLRGIIQSIAPDILSSMLKNLLNGKHLTEQRVGEILQGNAQGLPFQVFCGAGMVCAELADDIRAAYPAATQAVVEPMKQDVDPDRVDSYVAAAEAAVAASK